MPMRTRAEICPRSYSDRIQGPVSAFKMGYAFSAGSSSMKARQEKLSVRMPFESNRRTVPYTLYK